MEVQFKKGETTQISVHTITLQPEDGNRIYAFHCIGCGHFHQKIGGRVSKIYPIYEPSKEVPVISRCRHCGAQYNFQTHDGYSSEKVKVILNPVESINYFYCFKGKDKLLEYTTTSVYSMVDRQKKQLPFFSRCSETFCSASYYFTKMT